MANAQLHVDGQAIEFDKPEPGTGDSTFIFAPPKSGSVFLNNMVRDLSVYGPQSAINIPSLLFDSGINFPSAKVEGADRLFNEPGYVFTGFRDWALMLNSVDMNRHKRVFMMRDPRDMLVSHYYSMAHSHPVPDAGDTKKQIEAKRKEALKTPIDEYVLGAAADYYRNVLDNLTRVWETPTMNLGPGDRQEHRRERTRMMLLGVRYEDVFDKKTELATRICQLFQWDIDPQIIAKVATKYDVFPDQERPSEHIRQVTPGNYRDKLKTATIIELNDRFDSHLRLFGYDQKL